MKGSFKAALVGVALGSHITGVYIVGATRDEWLMTYTPNFPSLLFVLAVALVVVEQDLVPRTQCPFSCIFCYFYNFLAAIFMTSLALRLIWLPLSLFVVRVNQKLASTLCGISAMKQPPLNAIIKFLECPNFQTMELLILAAYILYSVVKATGAYDRISCWINQMLSKCGDEPVADVPEPTPSCDLDRDTSEELDDMPPIVSRRNRY